MLHGFDVSEFNPPKLIPWHGKDFACIRLTSGLKTDKLAGEHVRRASHTGVNLLLGYAYLQAVHEGSGQAQLLLDVAHALEEQEHVGPIALAADVEDPLKGPPWPREKYSRCLRDFVEHIAKVSPLRACALYVSPAYLAQLKVYPAVHACPLWLADWTPPADVPAPWKQWTIWQHEVKEIAPDVPLDHDIFEGDASDWRRAFFPDAHHELGGIVTATQQASGHGPGGVEDFATRDEGPVIE